MPHFVKGYGDANVVQMPIAVIVFHVVLVVVLVVAIEYEDDNDHRTAPTLGAVRQLSAL